MANGDKLAAVTRHRPEARFRRRPGVPVPSVQARYPTCKQLLWIKLLASPRARLQAIDLAQHSSRAQKYGSIFCFPAPLPTAPVFHIFCGKHCVQGPPHACKRLISKPKSQPPKNMAASKAHLGKHIRAFPHIFCGQDCEQGACPAPNPLIPKGNIFLPQFYAYPTFPQFQPPKGGSSGILLAVLRGYRDNSSQFSHILWKRMCARMKFAS